MLMTFLTHVNLAPVETDPVGFLWQLRQPVAITVLLILLGLHFPLRGVILMIAARCRGLKPSRTSVILCAVELALGIGILCLARFSTLGLYILLATYLFCILVAEAINCYIYAFYPVGGFHDAWNTVSCVAVGAPAGREAARAAGVFTADACGIRCVHAV